jgi:hypothetical protein
MIRFHNLEELGAAAAAMSDKMDGDCGMKGLDDAASVLHARESFCAQCGVDASALVCARQVHGRRVLPVGEADRGRGAREWESALDAVDGLVTDVAGLPLGVVVADCVPVYLIDDELRAVGILHAGRRGTLGNISGAGVQALWQAYGIEPEEIHALIGPSAGPCCYEVSPEMAAAFADAGLPVRRRHLNLWQANALQLKAAGVRPERIEISGICTICDGRFYSHRADGTGSRNLAVVML